MGSVERVLSGKSEWLELGGASAFGPKKGCNSVEFALGRTVAWIKESRKAIRIDGLGILPCFPLKEIIYMILYENCYIKVNSEFWKGFDIKYI